MIHFSEGTNERVLRITDMHGEVDEDDKLELFDSEDDDENEE